MGEGGKKLPSSVSVFQDTFYFYLCICVCLYAPSATKMRECVGSPGAVATDSCEPSDANTGNPPGVFGKGRRCP